MLTLPRVITGALFAAIVLAGLGRAGAIDLHGHMRPLSTAASTAAEFKPG
jgi:hypothetical protein